MRADADPGRPGAPDAPARDAATRRALAHLRAADRRGRRERRRGALVTGYGVLLVAAVLGAPYLLAAAEGAWWQRVPGAAGRPAALAVALPALWAAVPVLAARHAAWHGPVGVDPATAWWALPQPLLRRRLLLPRLAAVACGTALAGGAAGAAAGFLLGTLPGAAVGAGAAAGAWAGAALGLGCVAVGVLVERYDRAVLRLGRRLRASGWVVLGGLAALAAGALAARVPDWLGPVLLWSGPWGWAVQPLVAAVGGGAPRWPVACALTAALLGAAAVWCARAAPGVPGEALRRRAHLVRAVTASLFSLRLRAARQTLRAPHQAAGRSRVRLPVPRRRWLLVPWRDATGLLRAPARVLGAAVALTAAVLLTAAAPADGLRYQVLVSALALGALYLAAAQLAEPARVDGDDPRRAGPLPYSRGGLALRHGLLPAAALLAGLFGVCGAGALTGAGHPGWPVLLLAAPTMVGAALVSAYRGSLPAHVALGVETPFGNTAPFQMALWYARGPLGALLCTVPPLAATVHAAALPLPWALWLVVAAPGSALWAHRAARHQG
ncbi:DUF6297 family protein [Streptomyces sp. TRM70308]|uniref:hypothetical protein n=1 Tax=Streptomyces sp. TRM70308 TaxID=3131932 RepID=UPI003D04C918